MRPSTKHAIAQRSVALLGFLLFMGPTWDIPIARHAPAWGGLLGLGILFFSILSATGVGPWGKRYKKLYLAEHQTSLTQIAGK